MIGENFLETVKHVLKEEVNNLKILKWLGKLHCCLKTFIEIHANKKVYENM